MKKIENIVPKRNNTLNYTDKINNNLTKKRKGKEPTIEFEDIFRSKLYGEKNDKQKRS